MESGGVNDNGHMSNEDTAIHHDSNDIFVSAQSKPKNSSSVIIGMICLAIIAACGIGFGVWAMLNGNQKVAKLNEQIVELNNSITEKDEKIVQLENSGMSDGNGDSLDSEEINGDIALDLLQEASVGKQLGYGVANANVYAKCVDGDKVSYWITYSNSHRVNTDVPEFGNVMFEKGDDGEWKFELSSGEEIIDINEGMTGNCTVLHGDK